MTLKGSQRRHLRALAHPLGVTVQVGRAGVTSAVLRAVDVALRDHELVKVRLPALERAERRRMAAALAEGAGAQLAGQVGRVVILYRRHPEEPRIALPA